MPDLFSFFKRFRTVAQTGAPATFATYDAFLHRFTDSPARFRLVCLKIGDCDWGHHARFTPPATNAQGTCIFMWELKWIPALHADADFPQGGWKRREVLVDLVARTFVASCWEGLRSPPVKPRPRWQLAGKPRPCNAFRSPGMGRGDPIERVTADHIAYRGYRTSKSIAWAGLSTIHFAKQAVNTNELPVLSAQLRTGDARVTVALPPVADHPFYRHLIAQRMLEPAALERFLASDDECQLTVLSTLGDLQLVRFDADAAVRVLANLSTDGPVDLGGLIVPSLRSSHRRRDYGRFPPDSFHFTFSTINGTAERQQMLDEVKRWLDTLGPGWTRQLRRDWSQFLELRGAALELRLSWDRSEGYGAIDYSANFYRRMLLAMPEHHTGFAPLHACVIPNATVSSHHGLATGALLPAPDTLHRPQLTLWRDDEGRCGITSDGWLYLWRHDDMASIVDEVDDEYADRGGPYYTVRIAFGDTAALTLKRGNGSAAQLIEFFQ